ncbi:MAG: F0F1 ATP synthase subunit B [Myxococcales bacterium]
MLLAAGLTDINVALVVWTLVTFGLLLIVLRRFAWRPILETIETREKTIAESIESAKRERAEAEKAAADMRASLEKARNEAADLIRRNQAEVAAAKAELMTSARKESEALLAQARTSIEEERRAAVADLRAQVVDIAIEAAGRLLQTQMDEKKQRQLVEEYLSRLPAERRA